MVSLMNCEIEEIFLMLDRIEEVVTSGRLPSNAAGELMSTSLINWHDRLSARLLEIEEKIKVGRS